MFQAGSGSILGTNGPWIRLRIHIPGRRLLCSIYLFQTKKKGLRLLVYRSCLYCTLVNSVSSHQELKQTSDTGTIYLLQF